MQKHDKLILGSHRRCQLCLNETNTDCILTDVAHYAVESGNLAMVARLACQGCRDEVVSVRGFVEQHGLCFGKDSALFREYVQPWLREVEPAPAGDEQPSIFQQAIQQQIKRGKLYHCAKLPQNCLQLVYYSSLALNHAERHERIRNTINQIMRIVPIPMASLEDIAVLVHCLGCFMHEGNVLRVLRVLAQRMLVEGCPVGEDGLWTQLYRGIYVGNVAAAVGVLLRDWGGFAAVFDKMRQVRGYIKKEQLSAIVGIKDQAFSLNRNPISPHQLRQGCPQCQKMKLLLLANQARMKNNFCLTLKTLMKEDQALREHILQIETKFAKEKQQFINKIIKLKDKIEALQHEDHESRPRIHRPRSSSDLNNKWAVKVDLDSVSERSEGTTKTAKQTMQKIEQNVLTAQTDKPGSSNPVKQNYFHRLVVHLPEFDPSLLAQDADEKLLVQTIENSMKAMREELQKLDKKNRVLENQSKRLLTILTRKQQRFIPLIHEKDEIIQRYENALWRMEHSLPVEDPGLAPRIQAILEVFKNDFLETMTSGTVETDRYMEEVAQFTPSKTAKKKQKKKESSEVKAKSDQKALSKKHKGDQKQCVIF